MYIFAGEKISENEAIEADRPISEIRKEPYALPAGFEWCDLDLNNSKEVNSSIPNDSCLILFLFSFG